MCKVRDDEIHWDLDETLIAEAAYNSEFLFSKQLIKEVLHEKVH